MMSFTATKTPKPAVSTIPLLFPCSHASIVEGFRAHMRSLPRHAGQKVLVVIDGIVSNPGCIMPWEEMVQVCKAENALSVIDAAHGIGESTTRTSLWKLWVDMYTGIVDVNLSKSQPDFWISNSTLR